MKEGFFEFDSDILRRFGTDGVFFTVAAKAKIQFFAVKEFCVWRVMGLVAGAAAFIKGKGGVF